MCRRGSAFEKRPPGDARRVDCRDAGRIRSRDLKQERATGYEKGWASVPNDMERTLLKQSWKHQIIINTELSHIVRNAE